MYGKWSVALLALMALSVPLGTIGGATASEEDVDIYVYVGETFEIKLSQDFTFDQTYQWRYLENGNYCVKLVSEWFERPPNPEVMGTTTKCFRFQAVNTGISEISFAICSLDDVGQPRDVVEETSFVVKVC